MLTNSVKLQKLIREIETLRAALQWIEHHSNDPGVINRAGKALLGFDPQKILR